MRVRSHGKYTKMIKSSPRGIARCDYSGLMVRHSDLVMQQEYRGTGLVWTGYWVNPRFADEPNPQNLTPLIKLDPVPLDHARPDTQIDAENTLASSVGVITIDVSGDQDITLTYAQFDNGSITFHGEITGPVTLYVPNTYNQFYANNITTGPFDLMLQVQGFVTPPVIIPKANKLTALGPQVVNTTTSLQIVYF